MGLALYNVLLLLLLVYRLVFNKELCEEILKLSGIRGGEDEENKNNEVEGCILCVGDEKNSAIFQWKS